MPVLSPTDAPAEVIDTLATILVESPKPLTLAQLKHHYGGPPMSKRRWQDTLRTLEQHGRIFRCSSLRGSPRYWGRDETHLAGETILALLREDSRTRVQLVQELGRHLPPGCSKAWREEQINRQCSSGLVHVHPPRPGKRSTTLSLQSPDPRRYFPKRLLKELTSIFRKLEKAGIRPPQTLAGLGLAIGIDPPARETATPPVAPLEEVKELILKGMLDIERDADVGALVSLRELRRQMPEPYQGREAFDRAILDLADGEGFILHRDNFADGLPEEERKELVTDGRGNYFMGIAKRV